MASVIVDLVPLQPRKKGEIFPQLSETEIYVCYNLPFPKAPPNDVTPIST
jgi:hypothetical protein